jgi:hypothetical protein
MIRYPIRLSAAGPLEPVRRKVESDESVVILLTALLIQEAR